MSTTPSTDRIPYAIALRLLSVILIATMTATIKFAESQGAHFSEILFFRQALAVPLVVAVIASGPGLASVRTGRLSAHTFRMIVGLSSMTCLFASLMVLPLAEATTFQFTMPMFATILAAVVLKEQTGWHRWGAVVVGFVGVLIVAQPGSGHIPLVGAVLGLAAASLAATVSILLRRIGRTESSSTTVFWYSVLSVPPLGLFYAFDLVPHPPFVWGLLVAIGLIGGAGQLALTASLKFAPVAVVLPMDYSSLLWATLYGWLLFGAVPGGSTWIGAPVLIASGLYIVWRERVRHLRETEQAIA